MKSISFRICLTDIASSEEAGDLAVAPGKLSPLDEYDDDSSLDNIAVSRAINTACRKAILGQVRSSFLPSFFICLFVSCCVARSDGMFDIL